MPQGFFMRVAKEIGISLPQRNHYGIGMTFLPQDEELRSKVKALMDEVCPTLRGHSS
jgi:glutamate synthase (NADPH) large chain